MSQDALIFMRNTGQIINHAMILNESFRIETADLGIVTIKTADVKTIIYQNLPSYPTDMLRTNGASEYNGNVLEDPIRVESADLGGQAAIAKAKILSIVW